MLSGTSNPNSPPPTSHRKCLLPSLQGRHLPALFVRFFTLGPFSHKVVMDMEIQFLHEKFTEKDPKSLMGHIRIMASGEAPFFARTLSLVYDKLVEKTFAQPFPSGSSLGKSAEVESAADPFLPLQPSTSIFNIPSTPASTCVSPVSSFIPRTPTPNLTPAPASSSTATQLTWLQCRKCHQLAELAELGNGLRCPRCLKKAGGWRVAAPHAVDIIPYRANSRER